VVLRLDPVTLAFDLLAQKTRTRDIVKINLYAEIGGPSLIRFELQTRKHARADRKKEKQH